jgi:hypothetical protein
LWIKFLTSAIDSKNAKAIKTQSITIIALHLLSDIALSRQWIFNKRSGLPEKAYKDMFILCVLGELCGE